MILRSVANVLIFTVISLFLVACRPFSEATTPTAEPTTATESLPADTTASADPAPPFSLSTLDGEEVSLSSFQGEWVILNFWATWCPPCITEMPYLQSLADRGLNVLGVNMAEPAEEVKLFTIKHNINFPILMEPDTNLVLDYQARQLPRTVIIAPNGTIALRIAGPIDGEQLDPWLIEHDVH